jgi:cellulose biosynthesis protein BcsQ
MADKTPDMSEIIRPIGPNLQLAPGHLALAEIDLKLVSVISREQRLARALAQLESSLDYVVIDSRLRSASRQLTLSAQPRISSWRFRPTGSLTRP